MPAKKKEAADEPTLDATLADIEQLVELLEQEDTPLEESLRAFEQGVSLIHRAQGMIEQAEQRVSQLLADADGNPTLEPVGLDPERDD